MDLLDLDNLSHLCGCGSALFLSSLLSIVLPADVARLAYALAAASILLNAFAVAIILNERRSLRECLSAYAVLSQETKRYKAELSASDFRIHELESENQRLHQMLLDAMTLSDRNMHAAQQLRGKCGDQVRVAQHSVEIANECKPTRKGDGTDTTDRRFGRDVAMGGLVTVEREVMKSSYSFQTSAISAASDRGPLRDSTQPSKKENQAAKIEAMIRKRVLDTVNMAFDVCRKQGRFCFEDSLEVEEAERTRKTRIDSAQDERGTELLLPT